ncbi:hypothetical protein [Effusibacillus pohliae]|uniref:hypothetical protein n=1 Tax=Effusibacillus pohliae TaxID=232270 RepID=UPI000360E8AF|nr:hypothetical protein [Effusibacillus pohliae]
MVRGPEVDLDVPDEFRQGKSGSGQFAAGFASGSPYPKGTAGGAAAPASATCKVYKQEFCPDGMYLEVDAKPEWQARLAKYKTE